MKALVGVVAVAGILVAGVGYAQSGAEVVKAKGCLGCHEVDKKKVGPSFKDISAKNAGTKDAEGNMIKALKEGKIGAKSHPKSNASDAELKAAVQYVLSQK